MFHVADNNERLIKENIFALTISDIVLQIIPLSVSFIPIKADYIWK